MKRYLYWLLPFGWMAIIYSFSATPYEKQDIKPLLGTVDLGFIEPFVGWISFTYHTTAVSVEELGVNGFIEFFIRKGAHVSVFFLLSIFFFVALNRTTSLAAGRKLLLAFSLTVLYAFMDEFRQSFTPNRTPYIGDVLLDSIGGLLAILLIFLFNRRKWQKGPD